jgi:hypothetical protein
MVLLSIAEINGIYHDIENCHVKKKLKITNTAARIPIY